MVDYKCYGEGIKGFQEGPDWVEIHFQRGEIRFYNFASAGKENIEKMKSLAYQQKGLEEYILQYKPEPFYIKVSSLYS